MSILKYLIFFKNEGKEFRNILVYNSSINDSKEIDEIGKFCHSITFSFENTFLVNSFSAKLRFNRNLKFLNSNFVLSRFLTTTYDLIIMEKPDINLINLINQNEFIQHFIILNDELINNSRFDYLNNGIYKRNLSKIIIDVTKEESQYKQDLEKMSALDRIIHYSRNRHEKNNNTNDKKESLNNFIQPIKSRTNDVNENFSTINVVNLVPHETKFNEKFEFSVNDGVIAIYMVISNTNDFQKYIDCKNKILEKYENVKSYIILNGKESNKFLKHFNDVEFLMKSNIKYDDNFYLNIFRKTIKNEYRFNLNIIDETAFDKNIWELI